MALLDRRRRYRKGAAQPVAVPDYLKLTAKTAGTFTLTIPAQVNTTYITSVSYSVDGVNWVKTNNTSNDVTITTPTIAAGGCVYWKGLGSSFARNGSSGNYSTFSSTGTFDVSGNIMSLLYGDDFEGKISLSSFYTFCYLFYNSKVVQTDELSLPATTLITACYMGMFSGCTSLTTPPSLPATTLQESCYDSMFNGCTSLTSIPLLPATTLPTYCYANMFAQCASLTGMVTIPATTLNNNSCRKMFAQCTNLNGAILYAQTLGNYSLYNTFYKCSNFTYLDIRYVTTVIDATNYSKQTYIKYMLEDVNSAGRINASRVWRMDLLRGNISYGGPPSGWTIYTY